MMVYYTQDYRVSGICPLSNILKEHKIPETGIVSILKLKHGKAPSQLSMLKKLQLLDLDCVL
jgi:hypothetical protein